MYFFVRIKTNCTIWENLLTILMQSWRILKLKITEISTLPWRKNPWKHFSPLSLFFVIKEPHVPPVTASEIFLLIFLVNLLSSTEATTVLITIPIDHITFLDSKLYHYHVGHSAISLCILLIFFIVYISPIFHPRFLVF